MKNRKARESVDSDELLQRAALLKLKQRNSPDRKKEASGFEKLKLYLIPGMLVTGILASWYYNMWLSGFVNTPLNEPRIINTSEYRSAQNLDRYWGTYRFEY